MGLKIELSACSPIPGAENAPFVPVPWGTVVVWSVVGAVEGTLTINPTRRWAWPHAVTDPIFLANDAGVLHLCRGPGNGVGLVQQRHRKRRSRHHAGKRRR